MQWQLPMADSIKATSNCGFLRLLSVPCSSIQELANSFVVLVVATVAVVAVVASLTNVAPMDGGDMLLLSGCNGVNRFVNAKRVLFVIESSTGCSACASASD